MSLSSGRYTKLVAVTSTVPFVECDALLLSDTTIITSVTFKDGTTLANPITLVGEAKIFPLAVISVTFSSGVITALYEA